MTAEPDSSLKLEPYGENFLLVIPVPADLACNGFHSTTVLLTKLETRPRIIERHLRVLGWSRSSAKRKTNDLLRKAATLFSPDTK